VSYEAATLIEPAQHPVLFAEDQISVDEVPAQDGPAIRRPEELLILVEDEIGHEILTELEHELEELLAVAPPALLVRLVPPHGYREGIRQGGQYNQVAGSSWQRRWRDARAVRSDGVVDLRTRGNRDAHDGSGRGLARARVAVGGGVLAWADRGGRLRVIEGDRPGEGDRVEVCFT
jgi:hypothetical protein